VQLHSALEAERFGKDGQGSPGPALLRDIESALRDVPARIRRRSGLAAGLALVLLGGAAPLGAQDGRSLYARREYAAAAQAFRKEPPSPARWYDIAAAEYMARRDAYAVAALLSARAAAPRDSRVKALWTALSREHEQLRRAGQRWPVTALELFGAGLVLLWFGAVLFVLFRRHRTPAAVAVLLSLAALLAGAYLRNRQAVPRAVLAGGASLRLSPHGLAPERGTVPPFAIVRLDRPVGSWWLIETAEGARGWVPEEILAASPR
jgi:hypothetical protein